MATKIGMACCHVGDAPIKTITVEIAPGPASSGIPRGVMPMSSLCEPSSVSLDSLLRGASRLQHVKADEQAG